MLPKTKTEPHDNIGDGTPPHTMALTKADLYDLGLSGTPNSAARRQRLLAALGLPLTLSTNALLDVLNTTVTEAQFYDLLAQA